jgi:hypothetical protein
MLPRLPVQDYDRAIHAAVSWLADRYLLAGDINMHPVRSMPFRYFTETRNWQARDSARS